MKISCHIVLTQQGVGECRRGVAGSMEKREKWEEGFFPPLLSLFPPFLSCLCEHTGALESFTDYLTHALSFWRAFNGGGLSGSESLLTLTLPSLLPAASCHMLQLFPSNYVHCAIFPLPFLFQQINPMKSCHIIKPPAQRLCGFSSNSERETIEAWRSITSHVHCLQLRRIIVVSRLHHVSDTVAHSLSTLCPEWSFVQVLWCKCI